jgi:hypothetical protein
MLSDFIPEKSKFALIAVRNAYTDFTDSNDFSTQLSNGIWVLLKVPIDIDKGWKEWIGSFQYKELQESNLVFIFVEKSDNPEILDAHHNSLGNMLSQFFNVLQLDGVLEYKVSNLILGSYYDKRSEIRQMAKLPLFYRTKGYTPLPLNVKKLEKAVLRRKSLEQIDSASGSFARLIRGWNILMDGLQKDIGEERIHQFVRSIEALILPDVGKTKRQFIHRCQTFAIANRDNSQILNEAFELRSMCEHLNDWKPALDLYPEDQREGLALLRTRQMERLISFAYSRILEDISVRKHFDSEKEMQAFWKMQEKTRIKMWGSQLDLKAVT